MEIKYLFALSVLSSMFIFCNMNIKKCLRCGHIWTRRAEGEPLACPSCKSYQYNIKPRKSQASTKSKEIEVKD